MGKFILPIFYLLVSLGLFFGYVDPKYDDIKELQAEDKEFSEALERARDLEEIQSQLNSKYNSFSPDNLERLNKLLPDSVNNVRLILDIDKIASTYNLRTRDLRLEESASGGVVVGSDGREFETATLTFSVEATYETFLQFLLDLESSLRVIDIVSLSFQASEDNIYTFTTNIETYWLR